MTCTLGQTILIFFVFYEKEECSNQTSSYKPLLWGTDSHEDAFRITAMLTSSSQWITVIFPAYSQKLCFLALTLVIQTTTSFSNHLPWLALGPYIGWTLLKTWKVCDFQSFFDIWFSSREDVTYSALPLMGQVYRKFPSTFLVCVCVYIYKNASELTNLRTDHLRHPALLMSGVTPNTKTFVTSLRVNSIYIGLLLD